MRAMETLLKRPHTSKRVFKGVRREEYTRAKADPQTAVNALEFPGQKDR